MLVKSIRPDAVENFMNLETKLSSSVFADFDLFVSSPCGRRVLDFPVASLSLALIATGISGWQRQNGLQRLWFHCCFPNGLFSPWVCLSGPPKFAHSPPSRPTPRLGNVDNSLFQIGTNFQE